MKRLKVDNSEKTHSPLSASGSEIWLNCPAAPRLQAQAPKEGSNPAAEEGTLAHAVVEYCLKSQLRPLLLPKNFEAEITNDDGEVTIKTISDEMKEHCETFYTYVMGLYHEEKNKNGFFPELLIEVKADLSHIDKEMGGTLDVALVSEFRTLHIIDFKYGFGKVEPKDNTQLLIYAVGIGNQFNDNFDDFLLHIVQPRRDDWSPETCTQAYSASAFDSWTNIFRSGVARTKKPGAKPFAGKHCKWCKARFTCDEFEGRALEVYQGPKRKVLEPGELTPTQMQEVLEKADMVEAWIDAVRARAADLVKRGGRIHGFKLVESLSHRRWKDPAAAEKFFKKQLGEKIYEKKFLSPSQLEKKVPRIKSFVDSKSSRFAIGSRLVKESERGEDPKIKKLKGFKTYD